MTGKKKKTRQLVAYCWRGGQIEFDHCLPDGALRLLVGPARQVRRRVEPRARLAYDNKTLLVPGVPEADNEEAALEAVIRFSRWLKAPARKEAV